MVKVVSVERHPTAWFDRVHEQPLRCPRSALGFAQFLILVDAEGPQGAEALLLGPLHIGEGLIAVKLNGGYASGPRRRDHLVDRLGAKNSNGFDAVGHPGDQLTRLSR